MNKHHQMALQQFAQFQVEIKCLSQSTRKTREQHLRVFFGFTQHKAIQEITISVVYDFIKHLKNKDRTFHSKYSIH